MHNVCDTPALTAEKSIALSHAQILKLIPHRYPMLLVDRLESVIPFESACGIKALSVNEELFQGHFPSFPIMPGVLIIEALAQTAGVLVSYSMNLSNDTVVYFMSIENARFRQPVFPGCLLHLHVKKIQNRKAIWKFQGEAYVDGRLHAEAVFTAMVGGTL